MKSEFGGHNRGGQVRVFNGLAVMEGKGEGVPGGRFIMRGLRGVGGPHISWHLVH